VLCLDTNTVIGLLKKRSPFRGRYDAARLSRETIAISAVALFELRFGADKSAFAEANHQRLNIFIDDAVEILPFAEEDAAEAGAIRAYLQARGTPIGPYDTLIAAQARRRGATLVTSNLREFERVPGLMLADWGKAA
jgi:tRNA(fMet)-specific endonuclease VapC